MPFRAENDFTDEEWIAAFSLVLPPDRARQQALSWISLPTAGGAEDDTAEDLAESEPLGPASYDGDLLDLLSLVSDDCAARAWRLLRISDEEGKRRREAFRRKIDEALRGRDQGA
jgi:hypothetical protein